MKRGRGNLVTQHDGSWCPVLSPELLEKRLRTGRLRFTDDGMEKFCTHCQEWWPFDTEFFWPCKSNTDGLFHWCKACYLEITGRTSAARAAAKSQSIYAN